MSDAVTQAVLDELSAIRRELAEVREKLAYREQIFVGWKEIAVYLNYSEDHCKELGQDQVDPIPHQHEGGRVVAQRSMLDAWLFRRRKPAQKRSTRLVEAKEQLDMFGAPMTPKRGRASDGSAS
jgi:hypothetical protein